MATTVHEPPKIELPTACRARLRQRRLAKSGPAGWRHAAASKDYSPPPASTGIWVGLAAITMTFAAFTSALIVRQGASPDWQHFTLPSVLYLNSLLIVASSMTLEIGPSPRLLPSWAALRRQADESGPLALRHALAWTAVRRRPDFCLDAIEIAGIRTLPPM